jgi:hypothetical protein
MVKIYKRTSFNSTKSAVVKFPFPEESSMFTIQATSYLEKDGNVIARLNAVDETKLNYLIDTEGALEIRGKITSASHEYTLDIKSKKCMMIDSNNILPIEYEKGIGFVPNAEQKHIDTAFQASTDFD